LLLAFASTIMFGSQSTRVLKVLIPNSLSYDTTYNTVTHMTIARLGKRVSEAKLSTMEGHPMLLCKGFLGTFP
jgi:hypothetical protein